MPESVIDRRDFIKSTVTGVGGFFLLASNDKKQEEMVRGEKQKERKVICRTLGRTGMRLPVISMGVSNCDNPNLVRAALDAGIVYLDTAPDYQRGQNERMIGEVIKGRSRDSYIVSTKVASPRERRLSRILGGGLFTDKTTEGRFLEKLDTSLKSLGSGYVDILYNYGIWEKESALFEPVLKAMEKAKKAGKIRFSGISIHRNELEVIPAAVDSKFYDVILTSYNFRQKHHTQVREAIAKAAQAGLGIVAMKVMGGTVSGEPKAGNAIAALKWVLRDTNVHTVTLGFTTFDQITLDLSVMENPTLTDTEKRDLQVEASLPGLYCQGCGQCLKECLAKLPIPDLMRAYMYAYGYHQRALAQDLVVSLGLPRQICEGCSSCPVKCLNSWNVAGKIRDIVRLRDVPSEFLV